MRKGNMTAFIFGKKSNNSRIVGNKKKNKRVKRGK